ncbi:hypothetical protein Lalb_Chr12g0198201 [Lupinus albus]|uniref:Uncharacterized protein n=1 Tax=Lupinus albus TaxID=3870 RepID=A0A6A4PLI8_LUPAL|nr:hypothetical protein Lalb_Chr12g0198201 [Lupinus albus]
MALFYLLSLWLINTFKLIDHDVGSCFPLFGCIIYLFIIFTFLIINKIDLVVLQR